MSAYYNDNDAYCCQVLRARIADGSLPAGDVDERDIKEVSADDLRGYKQWHLFAGIGGFALAQKWAGWPDDRELLTGGFPCQDISTAGKRAGIEGARSGLWSEMARLIGELRPGNILVENVSALLSNGLGRVLGDLAEIGFDAEWHCIPAAAVGAHHYRARVWIVAHPNSARLERVHNARRGKHLQSITKDVWRNGRPIPEVYRKSDGIRKPVDRLRSLGNAIVPQVAERILSAMILTHDHGWLDCSARKWYKEIDPVHPLRAGVV